MALTEELLEPETRRASDVSLSSKNSVTSSRAWNESTYLDMFLMFTSQPLLLPKDMPSPMLAFLWVTFSLNVSIMDALAEVGWTRMTPRQRVTCIMANLIMMLAPAPLPSPITHLTLRVSRMLTRSSPICWMVGQVTSAASVSALASWPSRSTWMKTEWSLMVAMAGWLANRSHSLWLAPALWTVMKTQTESLSSLRWVSS